MLESEGVRAASYSRRGRHRETDVVLSHMVDCSTLILDAYAHAVKHPPDHKVRGAAASRPPIAPPKTLQACKCYHTSRRGLLTLNASDGRWHLPCF